MSVAIDVAALTREQLNEIESQRRKAMDRVFNGFIAERRCFSPIINELRFIHQYWYLAPFLIHNDGDKFELHVNDDRLHIHLAYIGVAEGQKRMGRGTKMMTALCEAADRHGYLIDLQINPKFGTNKRALIKFYKKFGFIKKVRGGSSDTYIRVAQDIAKLDSEACNG